MSLASSTSYLGEPLLPPQASSRESGSQSSSRAAHTEAAKISEPASGEPRYPKRKRSVSGSSANFNSTASPRVAHAVDSNISNTKRKSPLQKERMAHPYTRPSRTSKSVWFSKDPDSVRDVSPNSSPPSSVNQEPARDPRIPVSNRQQTTRGVVLYSSLRSAS